MDLLNKDTKPCPNCGTMICKISGCDQMWCPDCQTAFSWNKGTIEKGIVHNPHYYEFQRLTNNGVVPRNPGDIPCGGLPEIQSIRVILNNAELNNLIFSNVHQTLNHIQQVEIRRFNPPIDQDIVNRDLRIKYLMNEISEVNLKQLLQQNEKARQKLNDFNNIYQMFFDVGSDIFRQFINQYTTISGYQIHIRVQPKLTADVKTELQKYLNEQIIILERLIEYFNENLKKVGKIYNCVYPGINKNYRWENNYETYLRKNTN